jgi:hydroxyacylglutathione hydrolase
MLATWGWLPTGRSNDENPAIMRVMPGVHLVASGWLGASMSDAHDCHVFLVDDGDDAYLVDAGCGIDTERVLANIDRTGVDRGRIGRVLLTHGHADHAAGASPLAAALGAEIWASPETAAIVESADEQASGLANGRRDGIYPDEVRFVPAAVAKVLTNESFVAAGATVDAIDTPGHAAGHICFATAVAGCEVVFSGDLVFARGQVAVLETPDTDVDRMRSSIESIAARRPHALLAGHGSLVLGDAHRHLNVAIEAFESGSLPPALAV